MGYTGLKVAICCPESIKISSLIKFKCLSLLVKALTLDDKARTRNLEIYGRPGLGMSSHSARLIARE